MFFHIFTLAAHAIELPSVKAFVVNEKIMGGNASVMYWITNDKETSIRIPLDWFCDGRKYLEVRGDDGVVAAMPGGPISNADKKYITVDPGAVLILLGDVPVNEIFMNRRDGKYSMEHAIFGDVIKPFKIVKGVISDCETKDNDH